MSVLRLINVYKTIANESVLDGLDLLLEPCNIVVIRGRSGVGKTTLAKVAALILKPDRGDVVFNNVNVWASTKYRHYARRSLIGYIDQEYLLLPELSVRENIELSMKIAGLVSKEHRALFDEVVEMVGLSNLLNRYPDELSGGQRQRVAIARALVKRPLLVVGDEAFSSLDDMSTRDIIHYMRDYSRRFNTAFLITTVDLFRKFDSNREFMLENGKLFEIR